jgi:hypothetical protein
MRRESSAIIAIVVLTAAIVAILFLTSQRMAEFYYSMMSD